MIGEKKIFPKLINGWGRGRFMSIGTMPFTRLYSRIQWLLLRYFASAQFLRCVCRVPSNTQHLGLAAYSLGSLVPIGQVIKQLKYNVMMRGHPNLAIWKTEVTISVKHVGSDYRAAII